MTERKKVINGLEMSYTYSNVDEDNTLVPQQLVLDAIALLKAQEPATEEPKRIDLEEETKAWLDKMDAVDALGNIADICIDWDGYRTADGLGGLINEIWAYARYCADRLMKAQEPRVMTLDELETLQEDDVIWVEIKPVGDLTCISTEIIRFVEKVQDPSTWLELHTTDSAGFYMTRKTTEPNWRVWTSPPTDEQREATPWN